MKYAVGRSSHVEFDFSIKAIFLARVGAVGSTKSCRAAGARVEYDANPRFRPAYAWLHRGLTSGRASGAQGAAFVDRFLG